MIKFVLVFPLLLLFMLPAWSFADSNGEAPLTLLNKPQKSTQSAQNQTISQQVEQLRFLLICKF